MAFRGRVENGVIRLDGSAALPEGAEVRVGIVTGAEDSETPSAGVSLYDRLKPLIGAAKHLPEDASANVDHYLYGHPKQ